MLDIRDMPPKTLLTECARFKGSGSRNDYLARFLHNMGYRIFTSKAPDGRHITKDDIRHLLFEYKRRNIQITHNLPDDDSDEDDLV